MCLPMLYVYFNFFGYFVLAIRIEKCGNFAEEHDS